MDWQRILIVLEVFHKAQNVPNTEVIRKRAMEELVLWNTESAMEPMTSVDPKLEFGARRL